jgi:hypothetical protein
MNFFFQEIIQYLFLKIIIFVLQLGKKLVKNILSNFKDYPVSTVIDFGLNNSTSNETFYSEIISPIFIHNNLNDELIECFLQRQSIMLKKMKPIQNYC